MSKLRTWNQNSLHLQESAWTHIPKISSKTWRVYVPCPAKIVCLCPYPLRFPPKKNLGSRRRLSANTWVEEDMGEMTWMFQRVFQWISKIFHGNLAAVDGSEIRLTSWGWQFIPLQGFKNSQVVTRISEPSTQCCLLALQAILKKNNDQTECRLSFTWNFSNIRCLDSILGTQLGTAMSLVGSEWFQKTEQALHGSEWFVYNYVHMCTVYHIRILYKTIYWYFWKEASISGIVTWLG